MLGCRGSVQYITWELPVRDQAVVRAEDPDAREFKLSIHGQLRYFIDSRGALLL